MRSIREIMFTPKELDVILIQPNFLMKILKEEQNQIVREYWESMENQEPLGDLPNEVNHGLFSLAAPPSHFQISQHFQKFQKVQAVCRFDLCHGFF